MSTFLEICKFCCYVTALVYGVTRIIHLVGRLRDKF